MMQFLDRIVEFFRKKEYYEVNYESLNSYSIEFDTIDEEVLEKIEMNIRQLDNWTEVNSQSLVYKSHKVFRDLNSLMEQLTSNLLEDYNETYLDSLKYKWDFNYFLMQGVEDTDMLVIANRITKSSEEFGHVIYPVLGVKRIDDKYHIWNLLEEDE